MITLKAHFDGRVLVPEEAVDLPLHRTLEIRVEDAPSETQSANLPLAALADWAEQLPDNPDSPTDGAAQHDHYLYRTPKRP